MKMSPKVVVGLCLTLGTFGAVWQVGTRGDDRRLSVDRSHPFHPRQGDRYLLLIGAFDRQALTMQSVSYDPVTGQPAGSPRARGSSARRSRWKAAASESCKRPTATIGRSI